MEVRARGLIGARRGCVSAEIREGCAELARCSISQNLVFFFFFDWSLGNQNNSSIVLGKLRDVNFTPACKGSYSEYPVDISPIEFGAQTQVISSTSPLLCDIKWGAVA